MLWDWQSVWDFQIQSAQDMFWIVANAGCTEEAVILIGCALKRTSCEMMFETPSVCARAGTWRRGDLHFDRLGSQKHVMWITIRTFYVQAIAETIC